VEEGNKFNKSFQLNNNIVAGFSSKKQCRNTTLLLAYKTINKTHFYIETNSNVYIGTKPTKYEG